MSSIIFKKYDFLVLGGSGMQGQIVSRDLLENKFSVLIADLRKEGTERLLKKYKNADFKHVDLRDIKRTAKLIKKSGAKVVINCAEGDWNLNVYKACLAVGRHIIDLGSEIPMTKEQLNMSRFFKERGLTAITGCGSTPGINNIMFNYASNYFDNLLSVEAGFAWDSNVKKFVPPFSIQSIVEEFTDPAPLVEEGKWIKKIPLETLTEKKIRTIGNQQCFFVRHPETFTFYHNYRGRGLKTVRFYAGFPEHSMNTICTFIETGLASREDIDIGGKSVKPIDLLAQTLRTIPRPADYTEKENLWVNIIGDKDGQQKQMTMECLVDTLPGWEDAGCNIDTGMPASIIGQMIKSGVIAERGSFAPESIVPHKTFFSELRKRSMSVYKNGKLIN